LYCISFQAKIRTDVHFGQHNGLFANGCESALWLVDIDFWWMCIDPIWDRHRTNDLTNHFVTAFLLAELYDDADAAASLALEVVAFPGITYETTGFWRSRRVGRILCIGNCATPRRTSPEGTYPQGVRQFA
jgi:hypothetical protein